MSGIQRPCQVCLHPERVRIELMLAGQASFRSISRKYKLHDKAVSNHWNRHVTPERKASLLVGPVQKQALAAQVAEESASVLDHYRAVRAGLYALYDAAVTAGDRSGGALIAGRLLRCLDSMARITGQLATSPLVQVNNTTTVFTHDPGFARFEAQLIRVLSRFPDARAAVIAEFQKLAPGTGGGPVTIDQPAAPALPAPSLHAEDDDDDGE